MDYLGQIIRRANDKNETIKQQVTWVLCRKRAPL